MPIRSLPKVHYLLVRTQKLTVFLTLSPKTTIAQVKEEALSALLSDVNTEHAEMDGTPKVSTADDFELSRVKRGKERERHASLEPMHEILDKRRSLLDYGFTSWETLFFQFKSEDGELQPVTAILPSVDDEDVEVQPLSADAMSEDVEVQPASADTMLKDAPPAYSTKKGKRKASPDEYEQTTKRAHQPSDEI